MKENKKGRVTLPTDENMVKETLEIMEKWGADALRDCDGTAFPKELRKTKAKIYATYYMTRKDNEFAKSHQREWQQCYVMTPFYTALGTSLEIPLLKSISSELLSINSHDDIYRWWEVVDRTAGEVVPTNKWHYDDEKKTVHIENTVPFREYTVSFLSYIIWDPVHMYNSITSAWEEEHQIPFDVRQPESKAFSKKRLVRFIEEHPYVDVIRFTTFFHQFTLLFNEMKKEKYVDWFGYSASVSPYILEQFEKEVGYPFRPEYIIDEGYYQNQYRLPTKEYLDFVHFQNREVCKLIEEFTRITHEMGKEAMMFLGDHWIGTEPYLETEFSKTNLDAVVGSVGNGATLRLISEIPNVKMREGRLLPYFFKDTFKKGGDPTKEALENWILARRAIFRKPIDRIGYGGYLKLALEFPDFVEAVAHICDEFREIYNHIHSKKPYVRKRVAILSAYGKMRSFGCHMVHHSIYFKENLPYYGILEALSGLPYEVGFLSFEDILKDENALSEWDVILNMGDGDTSFTGGAYFENPKISERIRKFVYEGGGFIGVGEPSGHQYEGHYFQLATMMGVEKETGFTLGYDKYNLEETREKHFILEDVKGEIDFGYGEKGVYAYEGTEILKMKNGDVKMASHSFGRGRSLYIAGLPFSFENSRMLDRSLLYVTKSEKLLQKWFSENPKTELHSFEEDGFFYVVNNSRKEEKTVVFKGDGSTFPLTLNPMESKYFEI